MKTAKRKRPRSSTESIKLPNVNGLDPLVLAFSKIGGSAEAVARELGVTKRRVYSILDKGVGKLPFHLVVNISDRSGIPIDFLRIGQKSDETDLLGLQN